MTGLSYNISEKNKGNPEAQQTAVRWIHNEQVVKYQVV